jgi:hypothetical protein
MSKKLTAGFLSLLYGERFSKRLVTRESLPSSPKKEIVSLSAEPSHPKRVMPANKQYIPHAI